MAHKQDRYLVLTGVHEGFRYRVRLAKGGNTVGAHRENHICLKHSGISKRHAVLRLTDDRLVVEDLASKNGTFVDGKRVSHASLEIGDCVAFSAFRFMVEETSPQDAKLAIDLDCSSGRSADSRVLETTFVDEGGPPPSRQEKDLVFPPAWLPGETEAMAGVFAHLRRASRSRLAVLIQGETGVGKEGIARTLHLSSPRAKGPFVALNCAAIPGELVEAELFGVAAGVATGVAARDGRFAEADGGTLFLDEISDLPTSLQPKLLRALQEQEIQPLGSRPRPIDVRVVSATHSDLGTLLAAGDFRYDLFYRLAGVTLHVPPLRQRACDIPALVAHFMTSAVRAAGADVRGLTLGAMQLVREHPWPGNVRQLRSAVERWVHQCPAHQVIDAVLVAEDLASLVGPPATAESAPSSRPDVSTADTDEAEDFDVTALESLHLATIEERLIREALRRAEGNLTRASAALGLSRQALRRRLERHGIHAAGSG